MPVEYTNSIGMKFVLIPPGEFTMGSTAADIEAALEIVRPEEFWEKSFESEGPQHKVVLTQPFYIGVHEVTQAQYEQLMGKNPSLFAAQEPGDKSGLANRPVENVSWNDAAEFCVKICEREKLRPFYFRSGETVTPLAGNGYRLPTDAEWEFACRAGTTTKFWTGEDEEDLLQVCWRDVNSGGRTHDVGKLKANPFGIHDILGNLCEWVQDWWEPNYYEQFQAAPAIDPVGPLSSSYHRRVLRGGAWVNRACFLRSSGRGANDPIVVNNLIGFRVVLPVAAVKTAASSAKTPTQKP